MPFNVLYSFWFVKSLQIVAIDDINKEFKFGSAFKRVEVPPVKLINCCRFANYKLLILSL